MDKGSGIESTATAIETADRTAAPELPSLPRAKHLRRTLTFPTAAPDLVPARMINEVLYCERLMYLEWAQGEFDDNVYTVEGRTVHVRADAPGTPLRSPPHTEASAPATPEQPSVEDSGAGKSSKRRRKSDAKRDPSATPEDTPPYQARSVWLSSEKLGMTAKIDVVDAGSDGKVSPIEYKRGKRPNLPEGAYIPERAQLCAQVLLLREHGYACDTAYIYYAKDHQRTEIAIDDALIETTREAARRVREVTEAGQLPPPLVDSPKCRGCSLAGICLPDEVTLVKALRDEPVLDADDDSDVIPAPTTGGVRRLQPASDDRVPLYVQEQGARVGLDGYRLVVRGKDTTEALRLMNTSQVCVIGNAQVSTQALRTLMERGIPVVYFTYGGWYVGRTIGATSNNIELKVAQHLTARDPVECLRAARGFVHAKILNCRTLLRRNASTVDDVALFELKQLARKALEATSRESLLGIEGSAARTYFQAFTGMVKASEEDAKAFDWSTRNRRPPKDPINALLSFAYALLTKDMALATTAVGLEPLLGVYHQPRFGRPALALDLMEEFRPLVADSVVITAINNAVITEEDFIRSPVGVSLAPHGRRRFMRCYEQRMDQLVTHPVFGYRISYRRVLEVQARLFSRWMLGEIDTYPHFRTR